MLTVLGPRRLVIIALAGLLALLPLYLYKAEPSSAADKEIAELIREAETMVQRMTIPPKDYVGKASSLPEAVKRQMLEDNLRSVERLFAGSYKDTMRGIVNHHFSQPMLRNCVDGGVSDIAILQVDYTETGAEVVAEVRKYLVHREIRDGRLVDVRLDGKGTYSYTLEKTPDGWKITNIGGGPDLDASKVTIIPVK